MTRRKTSRKRSTVRRGAPLVSVITVCRNAARTIERTLDSVVAQSYHPVEHIVIDGGSTDGTLEILRRHKRGLSKVISEPDRGISDAFNKGIKIAQGTYIHILNADDWMEPDTIERGVTALEHYTDRCFAFGDLIEENPVNGERNMIEGDAGYDRWIRYVMGPLNHPTMLVRRSIYDRYGVFDERWTVAMDYDLLLRVHNAGERGVYVPGMRVHMTTGGVATHQAFRAFKEVRDISIQHGFPRFGAFAYQGLRVVKHLAYRFLRLR